jgi:hypothetical protein
VENLFDFLICMAGFKVFPVVYWTAPSIENFRKYRFQRSIYQPSNQCKISSIDSSAPSQNLPEPLRSIEKSEKFPKTPGKNLIIFSNFIMKRNLNI